MPSIGIQIYQTKLKMISALFDESSSAKGGQPCGVAERSDGMSITEPVLLALESEVCSRE